MSRETKPTKRKNFDKSIDTFTAQERFLRQILDINPNLIFAKDRQGRFTLVNQALADTYGTTIDQLVGKTDADFNSDPEQVAFFRRMDLQVMDSLQELLIPEEVITDAAGKRHWLQTVKRPIIGPDGTANQVLGVATDITQRRELEEQLRQAQKMEAIGQLAGGIAHDFNNMLAVILGNAERLLARQKQKAPADRPLIESLELIESAGNRAAELVSRLLTFSRKNAVAPIVLNVGEVVSALNELLQTMMGEHITLAVHRRDLDSRVRMDRGRLEQLIVNLVVNARDAMPSGGRIVIETVAMERSESKTGIAPSGPCVMMSVSDTGVGIAPEILDRIFEPFFSTKARGKGTGLGLSIAYGVAQQAGGRISVESTLGKGTMFRVFLPAVSDPLAPSEAVTRHAAGAGGGETVLVCEDEADVLRLMRDILTDKGYHVLTARDGAEAVQVARRFVGDIHLLLTDVVMPGMTGRQLADAIGTSRPHINVLFVTGYPADVLCSLADLKSSHQVIAKPFQAAVLLRSIRKLLDENAIP